MLLKISWSATLLKKRLWRRCFLVSFTKFLRTLFFYGTPLVAASDPLSIMMLQRMLSLKIQKQHYWDQFSNNVCGKLKLLSTLKMIWKLICLCKINWKLLKSKSKSSWQAGFSWIYPKRFIIFHTSYLLWNFHFQKETLPVKDFYSKYQQIRCILQICSHLLKKASTESFIFVKYLSLWFIPKTVTFIY